MSKHPKQRVGGLLLGFVVVAFAWSCSDGSGSGGAGGYGGAELVDDGGARPSLDDPLANASLWSAPSTWGGAVPVEGEDVSIEEGADIVLDKDVRVGTLEIHGQLRCHPERSVRLQAKSILVAHGGILSCGSEKSRMLSSFELRIESPPVADAEASGGIIVHHGGELRLFGAERGGWTRLAKSAAAGAQEVVLTDSLQLVQGDRIVIASTDFDPAQNEVREVLSVTGETVTFDQPLLYSHYGKVQEFAHANAGAPHLLDERAEVGLLSRNILIAATEEAETTGLGVHVMGHEGAKIFLDGVEIFRGGQKSVLARYPIHFHMMGDASGLFVRNSSVHHSFNRCVTVHGTDNLLIQGNVCYDHIGHGFFLEDGAEQGNLFERNLGLGTHRPSPGEELLVSDSGAPYSMGQYFGPATFWITNPKNRFVDNVAAGSDGSGFWFAPKPAPSGLSSGRTDLRPAEMPVLEFEGNVAHSSQNGLILGFAQDDGAEWYVPNEPTELSNFTGYKIKSDTGGQAGVVWLRGGHNVTFKNFVTADSRHHYNIAFDGVVDGGLLIGESENLGTPVTPEEVDSGRSLPAVEITGYGLYDGPHGLKNLHFAGFASGKHRLRAAINQIDGAYSAPDHWAQGLSFEDGTVRYSFGTDPQNVPSGGTVSVSDRDGSLTGHPGWYLTGRNPIMRNGACEQLQSDPNPVYACPGREAHFYVDIVPDLAPGDGPGVARIVRSDGAWTQLAGFCPGCGVQMYYQTNLLTNANYEWTFERAGSFPNRVELRFGKGLPGDFVTTTLPLGLSPIYVYRSSVDGANALQELASSAAVDAGDTGFRRLGDGRLYVKLKMNSEAEEVVLVCRTADCN